MVDVTEDFLVKAKTYLGEEGKRVRNYFCCGLQDFSPDPNSYDVIWIQWVIGEHSASLFHHPAHLPLLDTGSPGSLGSWGLGAPAPHGPAETRGALPVLPGVWGLCLHLLPCLFQLRAVFVEKHK